MMGFNLYFISLCTVHKEYCTMIERESEKQCIEVSTTIIKSAFGDAPRRHLKSISINFPTPSSNNPAAQMPQSIIIPPHPSKPSSSASELQHTLNDLLEQYLNLLHRYHTLQQALGGHLSSVCLTSPYNKSPPPFPFSPLFSLLSIYFLNFL